MSLTRLVERSREMSNWNQVIMRITDGSESITQSSAGWTLFYSTGSEGDTVHRATSAWQWLLAEQLSCALQGATRDSAATNSPTVKLFPRARARSTACQGPGAQLSLPKMHLKAAPAREQVTAGVGGLRMRPCGRGDIPAHKQGRALQVPRLGGPSGWGLRLRLQTDVKGRCLLAEPPGT